MDAFEVATAGQIVFGWGVSAQVGALARPLGQKALVVTGGSADRAAPIIAALDAAGIAHTRFAVPHEPTLDLLRAAVALAHDFGADCVIGFGGGAALDAGKAAVALATNPGDPLNYLEVIGRAQPLAHDPLPFIAIPTTAGTGTEVTRNAVIASPEDQVKVSLRSARMLPRIALIDPALTRDLPPALTASTGMDALTQVLEPFVSPAANPLTDGFCREGLRRVGGALRAACADGTNRAARESMALAALMGGMALANARLGAVHGFAAPIGGMFDAPHGAVCAALLAPVMRANLRALAARDPHSPALARYTEAAALLSGNASATAAEGVAWVAALTADLGIPSLRAYGIEPGDLDEIAEKAARASSMKGNPIALTHAELVAILEEAL